jgi:hypothetical protein
MAADTGLATTASPGPGTPLAWIRFPDAPKTYTDVRYLWLGDVDMRLSIEVVPQPGHVLDLLWGSKNDTRSAVLTVNGREIRLTPRTGYDGFRWLRLPLPPDAAKGDRYEVVLTAGTEGRPGFVAEVRLTGPEQTPSSRPDLAAPSSRITLATTSAAPRPPATAEAFPEMRQLWDREPPPPAAPPGDDRAEALFRQAERNARLAAEALYRCRRFVDGWLAHADPTSGLIPRNLTSGKDLWNARDAAADNYPFMVLTCALTDQALFTGRMIEMLRNETRLTSRVDRLPDDFLFSKQGFAAEKPNLDAVIFGAAEYVKDGLIPLTEWLGASPWSERMLGIVDDIWKHAPVQTPFGTIPTLNFEVNGDLLQACSRLFWFTGDRRYLDWAIRLGDYYLLGNQHPTRDLATLRLMDHGCEVVNGLSELYIAVSTVVPEKRKAYQDPLHALYDRLLEVGRNEHGLLYASINPKTGEHAGGLCDTWGYNYDGVYTVFLVDGIAAYRDAVRQALSSLKTHYTGHNWGGADGYADSIEGAINLYNREIIPAAGEWIDSEIRTMWGIQKSDGVVEGWHGDGNFARTTIMYALWKTQGITAQPWRQDLRLGAVRDGDAVCVSLAADDPWTGRLVFDQPRHKVNMKLPLDCTRINQFPEWFTTGTDRLYAVRDVAMMRQNELTGKELQSGVDIRLRPGVEVRLRVGPASP